MNDLLRSPRPVSRLRQFALILLGAAAALLGFVALRSTLLADPAKSELADDQLRVAQASKKPTESTARGDRPALENRVIRALADQLTDRDGRDGNADDGSLDALEGADAILSRIRRENRDAMATLNRQPRIRNCEKCNIVLIILDDVGWNDLGCYGQARIRTPNIDRLAAEGIRFTQFYAGAPLGVPSRGTLWSGRHTGHGSQKGDDWVVLRRQHNTLARVMWQAGYSTALIGKWGVGDLSITGRPNEQGFEYFFGQLERKEAENYYPNFLWRNLDKVLIRANEDNGRERYSPDLITRDSVAYVRSHGGSSRPYFLTVSYQIDHADNDLFARTGNGMDVPTDEPYGDENWPQPEKNKAAMITRADRYVGEIMDAVEQSGQAGQTMILVTSDNGPHKEGGVDPEFFDSNGPLRGIKGELYEGGIRVPLIAWGSCGSCGTCGLGEGSARATRQRGAPAQVGTAYDPSRGTTFNRYGNDLGASGANRRRALVIEFPQANEPWVSPEQEHEQHEFPTIQPNRGGVSDHVWAFYDLAPTIAGMVRAWRQPRDWDGLNMCQALVGGVAQEHKYLYWETHGREDSVAVRAGKWKAIRHGNAAWELYNLYDDIEEANDIAGENREVVERLANYAVDAKSRRMDNE